MDREGEKRKEGERKGRESGVKEGRWGDRVTEKDGRESEKWAEKVKKDVG